MNKDITKRFIIALSKFHNYDFITSSLHLIDSDSDRQLVIDYMEQNPDATKSDISGLMAYISVGKYQEGIQFLESRRDFKLLQEIVVDPHNKIHDVPYPAMYNPDDLNSYSFTPYLKYAGEGWYEVDDSAPDYVKQDYEEYFLKHKKLFTQNAKRKAANKRLIALVNESSESEIMECPKCKMLALKNTNEYHFYKCIYCDYALSIPQLISILVNENAIDYISPSAKEKYKEFIEEFKYHKQHRYYT